MKTAKKLIWAVLALLPVLPLLWILLGQIGQQKTYPFGVEGVGFFNMWTPITITETDTEYIIDNLELLAPEFTLTEVSLLAFTNTSQIEKESVYGAYLGLYKTLAYDINAPVSTPLFIGMLYLFYLAFLELVSLLIDLIMFVPRKCGEIFR